MKVVITGSSGLIGSQLVREIQHQYPDAYIAQVDLKDGYDCRDFFANDDGKWDFAVHCAAITGGIEGTMFNSAFQASSNSQTDGAYFQWALRVRPRRIVYISSSCAYPTELSYIDGYGLQESDINFETSAHNPDMPYGWAKLNGEVMANAVRDMGVATTIVRPFAIVGEAQEDCRIIPAFVKRGLDDNDTFDVWGPGTQASDFVHVSDCAKAILTAVNEAIDGPFNIGTGRGASADEIAELVMSELGIKKSIAHNLDKPSGPPWRVANPTLLESFYKPQVSLEETVARIVAAQR